jgi:hypothetical protein
MRKPDDLWIYFQFGGWTSNKRLDHFVFNFITLQNMLWIVVDGQWWKDICYRPTDHRHVIYTKQTDFQAYSEQKDVH